MSARFHPPGIGALTQLDWLGLPQNPLSMNRFLCALANPATLIDPTGHAAGLRFVDGVCQGYSYRKVQTGRSNLGMTMLRSARS